MPTTKQLLEKQQRIPFAGLTPDDDTEFPPEVGRHLKKSTDTVTHSFKDIINILPDARSGNLKAVNNFVNDDGTLEVTEIKETLNDANTLDFDFEDIASCDELNNVTDADQLVDVPDYIDIVDPRREALNAMGYSCSYRWQIATTDYAIINPLDAYSPAQRTFRMNGEAEEIFGWASIRDYGGEVDLYILFKSETVSPPGHNDDDAPLYIGIQSGYNFTGGRAFDSRVFGFNAKRGGWLYGLGPRNSRRHVGTSNQATTDIRDWWADEYERIATFTDDLVSKIAKAESTTLDFTAMEYSISDFYEYLDLPNEYAKPAARRVRQNSPETEVSMWTLSYSLMDALERNFQGQGDTNRHASPTFRVYAEIASDLIRSPDRQIEVVETEHRKAKQKNAVERDIDPNQVRLGETDAGEIDGVTVGHEPSLLEKSRLVQEKQKTLQNF